MAKQSQSEVPTFFTYIVRCSDSTLYIGWTIDLKNRLNAHNAGHGAKYTRGRGPVQLMASWKHESKTEAMRLEYALKKLSRREKEELLKTGLPPDNTLMGSAMSCIVSCKPLTKLMSGRKI